VNLPPEHRERPTLSTGFYDGSLPDWLRTADPPSDDAPTVHDASRKGGYARLEASDALETTTAFQADADDVLSLTVRLQASTGDPDAARVRIGLASPEGSGFEEPGLHADLTVDRLVADDGADTHTAPVRQVNPDLGRPTFELRWYTARDELELFQGDAVVARLETLPDPSVAYRPRVAIESADGAAHTLDVFGVTVGYADDALTR
jgi:hypothetical protein